MLRKDLTAHLFSMTRRGLRWASVFLCAMQAVAADSPANYANMLVIHSYHQGFEWTDSLTAGIKKRLQEMDGGNVRLSIEYMDSKSHDPADVAGVFFELCAVKYGAAPPDVILCSDNNALAFLIEHRAALFPRIPIVFCGINDYSPALLGGATDITGVVEVPSYLATAELGLRVNPDARRIYAIACSAKMSKTHIQRFMEEVAPLKQRVEIVALHDLTLDEFDRQLRKISKTDIIINLALHRTKDHKIFSSEEAYAFMRERTDAPIYNLWSSYLKDLSRYIIGGVMVDGEAQGRLAAEMGLKILHGVPPSQLPVITESPNIAILNYQELERIGAAREPFPAGAKLINRPFSFYETYRALVWGVIVVIAGLGTLSTFLFLNIQRRRRMELELRAQGISLRESEENLRITLGSIAEAVIATDTAGRVQHLNPVAEELTGWTTSEARSHPIAEVFDIHEVGSGTDAGGIVEQVMANHDYVVRSRQATLTSRDEREHDISGSGAPIRDDEGDVIGVVLVFRDITNELALQEELRQSQKMDAIGQLAGGIAHDFNNMLGGIVSATEMAQIELEQNKHPSDLLEMVLGSANRAASLIAKLLAFARQQPLEPMPIEIRTPIKDALSLFARTADKRVRVRSILPDRELRVMGDLPQLQNAFLNLFINASHAMPSGGELAVLCRAVELDAAYCEASTFKIHPGRYVDIEIRDTGEGIPEAALDKIFEPFFTTKEVGRGTGMGLAAVLGTVQQHKGAITVRSEPRQGTSFRVLLPLTHATAGAPHDAPREEKPHRTGRILVVDDEKVMRDTIRAILEHLGHEVVLAENGSQGVERYKREHERIDLVILDMMMPEMDGRDCFLALRAIQPHVKVIIASGFSQSEDLSDLRRKGLVGVIQKPFRVRELRQFVTKALPHENAPA